VAGERSGREGLESSTLREKTDGSTSGGDVPLDLASRADGGGGLLHGEEGGALVVGEGRVADDIGLGLEEQEALRELRNGNAGSTSTTVDGSGGESLGAGVLAQREAVRGERSALVGDEGCGAKAVVGGGAVLVEDVGFTLRSNTGLVQASTNVDAVDVEALDGWLEVQRLVGYVDNQAEAGGQVVNRVVGHNGDGGGSSDAGKAKDRS